MAWTVLGALVLTGIALSWVLGTYNQINEVRLRVADSWRQLAGELDARYSQLEVKVAKRVDDESIKMESGEEFRLALDHFRTTTQTPLQIEYARDVERLIQEFKLSTAIPNNLDVSLSKHNEQMAHLQKLVASPAGKLLGVFLQFEDTSNFSLAHP